MATKEKDQFFHLTDEKRPQSSDLHFSFENKNFTFLRMYIYLREYMSLEPHFQVF